jgi:hypothetical protein
VLYDRPIRELLHDAVAKDRTVAMHDEFGSS